MNQLRSVRVISGGLLGALALVAVACSAPAAKPKPPPEPNVPLWELPPVGDLQHAWLDRDALRAARTVEIAALGTRSDDLSAGELTMLRGFLADAFREQGRSIGSGGLVLEGEAYWAQGTVTTAIPDGHSRTSHFTSGIGIDAVVTDSRSRRTVARLRYVRAAVSLPETSLERLAEEVAKALTRP